MKPCRICQCECHDSSLRWIVSLGFGCSDCHEFLTYAEMILTTAGISGLTNEPEKKTP
jgi:hypothetical protein